MLLFNFLSLLALQFIPFNMFHEGYLLMREGSTSSVLSRCTHSLHSLHLIISWKQLSGTGVIWWLVRGAVFASGKLLSVVECFLNLCPCAHFVLIHSPRTENREVRNITLHKKWKVKKQEETKIRVKVTYLLHVLLFVLPPSALYSL